MFTKITRRIGVYAGTDISDIALPLSVRFSGGPWWSVGITFLAIYFTVEFYSGVEHD